MLRLEAQRCSGAPKESNLEAATAFSILEELENWSSQLKASPEVARKLREFEIAASGAEATKPAESEPTLRRGPHRSGPSR